MDGPTFNNRILGLGQKEELADILLYLIRFADMAREASVECSKVPR